MQGVSTRKGEGNYRGAVRAWLRRIATISAINKRLDEGLSKVAQRRLSEDYPYLILDARYEKGARRRHYPKPSGSNRDRHLTPAG